MIQSMLAAFTLLNWIPGYDALNHDLASKFGTTVMNGSPVESITHLVVAVVAVAVVAMFAISTRLSWAGDDNPVIPAAGFNMRNFTESIMDAVLRFGEMVLGSREHAKRFMPLIAALAFYIFFSNTLGLLPFWTPSTENLNVTIGPAIIVFIATHVVAIKEQGFHYIEHFLGPKIGGFWWLFPLFIPLEIISHIARPVSLALRLMGNMIGDHAVLAVFGGLFFTLPFLGLGLIVCTVQTLVFCLLSLVYIALSLDHSEEGH